MICLRWINNDFQVKHVINHSVNDELFQNSENRLLLQEAILAGNRNLAWIIC